MQLSEKKCREYKGNEKPFTAQDVREYLKQVKKWTLSDNQIEKEFKFKDFKDALTFVNKVGEIAEQEDHHPNIQLYDWNKVKLTLTTHAIKGLSENDFIIAAKIDKMPQ